MVRGETKIRCRKKYDLGLSAALVPQRVGFLCVHALIGITRIPLAVAVIGNKSINRFFRQGVEIGFRVIVSA